MSSLLDKESLTLDLKKNEYKLIECKQFDDLILHFIITNLGEPVNLEDYILQFNVARPNETFIIQSNGITKNSNGEVVIICEKGTTSEAGEIRCELVLTNILKKQVSTFDVVIDAKKSTLNGMKKLEPIVVTIIETLQDKINETNDKILELTSTIQKGDEKNTQLNSTIDSADSKNTELNNTISSGNTANSTLKTTIGDADNKIKEITDTGDKILSDVDAKNNLASQLQSEIDDKTDILGDKIIEMDAVVSDAKRILPMPKEVYHTLMNVMGMALFTEREIGKKYTGAYTNMEIFSFMNTDGLTLTNTEYDEANHKIDFGTGYVEGIAFCYE